MPMLAEPVASLTLTELHQRFGAMPLSRIVFDPAPGTATEDDVLWLEAQAGELCELVDGILIRKSTASHESILAGRILTLLNLFVLAKNVGWVLGEGGMLKLWPGRIRIPDTCFISRDQTHDGRFPKGERVARLYPDLAVEVLSKSNTREEMHEKLDDYFRAGTRLVWIIDPPTRTAEIYTGVNSVTHVTADGTLSGRTGAAGAKHCAVRRAGHRRTNRVIERALSAAHELFVKLFGEFVFAAEPVFTEFGNAAGEQLFLKTFPRLLFIEGQEDGLKLAGLQVKVMHRSARFIQRRSLAG
jgi:Uma2 family endonuclease